MELKLFMNCLQARKATIEETLQKRQNHEQDFSSWRFEPTEELKGRLKEINNSLSMLGVMGKEGVEA